MLCMPTLVIGIFEFRLDARQTTNDMTWFYIAKDIMDFMVGIQQPSLVLT